MIVLRALASSEYTIPCTFFSAFNIFSATLFGSILYQLMPISWRQVVGDVMWSRGTLHGQCRHWLANAVSALNSLWFLESRSTGVYGKCCRADLR